MTVHEGPQRRELAQFLQTRRKRITLADVGLTRSSRRRSLGLLREEVARLADVSITWYTWLEQGRPIRVSQTTLQNVARVLRLSPVETTHLFLLAERPAEIELASDVPEELRALLAGIGPNPAYLTTACWDVAVQNDAAKIALFDFSGDRTQIERNFVYELVTNPLARTLIADWSTFARKMVICLRGSFARNKRNKRFGEIIERCLKESDLFRNVWQEYDLVEQRPDSLLVQHPTLGASTYAFASFRAAWASDLRLTIFTPSDAEVVQRLRRAIDDRMGTRPTP